MFSSIFTYNSYILLSAWSEVGAYFCITVKCFEFNYILIDIMLSETDVNQLLNYLNLVGAVFLYNIAVETILSCKLWRENSGSCKPFKLSNG